MRNMQTIISHVYIAYEFVSHDDFLINALLMVRPERAGSPGESVRLKGHFR